MDLQDRVDVLVRLGLTPNQAKVYIALASFSPCTANQASKATCLAPEVVYRALPKLQEQGLVEKEITVPAKFKATPLKLAIGMLLDRKNRDDNQIRVKARKLLSNFNAENGTPSQEDFKITLIPKGKVLVPFVEKKLAGVQKRLDLVFTGQKFSGWFLTQSKVLQKVILKKVAVRMIVSGTESEYRTEFLEELLLNSNFQARFVHEEVLACVSVFDDKDAMICTSADVPFARSPVYWSNNPSVVELCKTYFEKFWKKEARLKLHLVVARKFSAAAPE
jgi:sugar-specific transcriptional regulator TrmB